MNIQHLLQLLRGVNPALADVVAKWIQDGIAALEAALPIERQYFVMGKAKELMLFLKTDSGKAAIRAFVAAWLESYRPPSVTPRDDAAPK